MSGLYTQREVNIFEWVISMKIATIAAGLVLLASATASMAATANIFTNEGGKNYLTRNGMHINTSVNGDDIDGTRVTMSFADGTVESLVWQTFPGEFAADGTRLRTLGGVRGLGASLTMNDRDYTLTTTKMLTSLKMEAGYGSAIFDILVGVKGDRAGNTLGSKIGYPYGTVGGDALTGEIDVTYSGALRVAGFERQTDTFTTMMVDYTGLAGGGLFGTTMFEADLDKLAVEGDLTPVPLPGGMPLLMAGAGALVLLRRRKT